MTPRDRVVESVTVAQHALDEALERLEHVPSFNGGHGFAAHALSNYLTVAEGTLDLLAAEIGTRGSEPVMRLLAGLRPATEMMSHLTAQLMGTSSGEEPRLVVTAVDLGRLVSKVVEFYRVAAARKRIHIESSAGPGGPVVASDAVTLAAVLDNLLSNAVKFSPPGARVAVTVAPVLAGVLIRVQDEGLGLSEEDRSHLFERGRRLSAVPTAGEPSSGYGLAVARELSERLGARLWCESEPGKGASFLLQVPERHPSQAG